MRQLYFSLVLSLVCTDTLWAQTDPCITNPIVAQGTGGTMTCNDPTVNLVATLNPAVVSYQWTGPNGFSSFQRIAQTVRQGNYLLIVTAANGCTATTTVTVVDNCTTAGSDIIPPECDNGTVTPRESCQDACVFKCLNYYYEGSTFGFSSDETVFSCASLSIDNDQWFAFMPVSKTPITLTATPSNCYTGGGIQIAIYDDCNSYPLACNVGGNGEAPVSVQLTNIIPGKAYYLFIDGWNGDECDFILTASPFGALDKLCETPNGCPPGYDCTTIFDTIKITGPSVICPGGTATYGISVPSFYLVSGYQWTGPPGTYINGNPVPFITYPPNGNKPQISFYGDSGTICVRTLTYFFPPSPPLCIDVGFNLGYETVLPDTIICDEDTPYWGPTGEIVYNSGNYVWLMTTEGGCDSIIRQKVKIKPPLMTSITQYKCPGSCVSFWGNTYCNDGFYEKVFTSYQGCDSTVYLDIVNASPIANIIANSTTLSCSQPTLFLNSSAQAGAVKKWLNLQTGQTTTGNSLQVTQPGTYTLTTTITVNNPNFVECSASDTIIITAVNLPTVTVVTPPIISCANPVSMLSATSNTPNATYKWKGPNNFNATGANQSVSVAGNYTVTVTDPSTGCTSTTTVVLVNQTVIPTVVALDDTITCYEPMINPIVTTTASNPTYTWLAIDARTYEVTVVDGITGCIAKDTINVINNTDIPSLEATGTEINCSGTTFSISASSLVPNAQFTWAGALGFAANIAQPVITEAGTYTVTVVDPANGCSNTATVDVTSNNDLPNLQISQTPPKCGDTVLYLQATSTTPGTTLYWTGDNGFSDSSATATVPVAAQYTAHAIGANRCEQTMIYSPIAPPASPEITASGDSLTCADPIAQLSAATNLAAASFAWTGPHGYTAQGANPVADSVGIYTVVVTSTTGCTASATASVVGDCVVSLTTLLDTDWSVRVFPVPSSGIIWMETTHFCANDVLQIDLYDALGQRVFYQKNTPSGQLERLDFQHLPAGNYVIRIQCLEKTWRGKVVFLK